MTLAEQLTMAASASRFYTVIGYENEANMKVAASNVNIKIHQKYNIGVRVTIGQWKTSGSLTRTGF